MNGNQMMFTTTQSYPVLTRGSGKEVTLLLQRTAGTASQGSAAKSALSGLPATFVGTIPCADCPGIQYQVNLLAHHSFTSRMVYLERKTQFIDHGNWQISDDGKVLVLQSERGARQQFMLRDADTLRQLDADGHEINSQFNYDL